MHNSDKLGFGIIGGTALLIGGSYLLFRILGECFLIPLVVVVGWFVLVGFTAKYFKSFKNDD